MEQLNHSLFLMINAGAHPPQWLLHLATFIAQDLVLIAPITLFIMLMLPGWRIASLKIITATVCAMCITALIRYGFPMPRPFVAEIGHTFLYHAPNASFPSNHGTFIFTVALGMLCWTKKWAGVVMLVVAVTIAWSRVYLGVHFPQDMLGGLLVGVLSCLLVSSIWKYFTVDRNKRKSVTIS